MPWGAPSASAMSDSVLTAVFIGSDTLLLECAERWLRRGQRIAAVATDADKVRRWAEGKGLCVVDAGADLAGELAGVPCDHLFAVTWLRLLPDAVLALPARSAINFHDGPLPRYAGLNAPVWAILAGEREHGVTWHRIESRADTGSILVQRTWPIGPDDTAFSLNVRCLQAGIETFAELVDALLAGTARPRAQDLAARTFFGRRHRPDAHGCLDWRRAADANARLVRALDHGGYPNPVAVGKVLLPDGAALAVGTAAVVDGGTAAPGTVLAVTAETVTVQGAAGALSCGALRHLDGAALRAGELAERGVVPGALLPVLDGARAGFLTALAAATAAGEDEAVRAARLPPVAVPGASAEPGAHRGAVATVTLPAALREHAAALWLAFVLRRTGRSELTVGVRWNGEAGAQPFVLPSTLRPLRVDLDWAWAKVLPALRQWLAVAAAAGPVARDLVLRRPDLRSGWAQTAWQIDLGEGAAAALPGALTFRVADASLHYDQGALPAVAAEALARQFERFAERVLGAPAIGAVPLLGDEELRQVRAFGRGAEVDDGRPASITAQFLAQVDRTPDRVALRCGEVALTYAQMEQRSAVLAGHLRRLGAGAGERVGLCLPRGAELVVAMLAVLRSGAAYVPMDPEYPGERLQQMAGDARPKVVVTLGNAAPAGDHAVVDLRRELPAGADAGLPEVAGDDLAYVIYTSGSTGRPKGVRVAHRNVTNFFAGMDAVLRPDADPGTWLAVTSPSFDISVLELLWTLCRGFTVVVWQGVQGATAGRRPSPSFSLFYFASDEGEQQSAGKYRLLLEGARFADAHGFEAVWTPERHFHAFGGLYPNPAVASAALATITKNVRIRAGSVVLPLHHPIRVAEEWALVDNLSQGRVDIAFAAGWMPNDFVLRPETFAERKQAMLTGIRQVQALWRGEAVTFPGPKGPVAVRTLPRPVQPELGTWVTIAGNPETFRQAGELGANVLTHLLGQSVEEVGQKLDAYRQAWGAAGHPGQGRVTMMLHTFVGPDAAMVKATVREPMKNYLRSAVDIVKAAAWSFPAFKSRVGQDPARMQALLEGGLRPDELDALLEFAFERYYGSSGLFGTPEECVRMVERLIGIGVDEVACLVDFGVPSELALRHLPHLDEVRRLCAGRFGAPGAMAAAVSAPATVPELLVRHRATHLQCTPSLAGMLLLDPKAAEALGSLRHWLVGGEALAPKLMRELRGLVPALHNMYGPTETTVWSTSWSVPADATEVSIGAPLANQQVHVLDECRQPVAVGETGELWIGGAGVVPGYFERPELTAERFVSDPAGAPGARMYRTGDLCRWRPDGVLEYLGRADFQVKIRGHRIELGEIEAALAGHPTVRAAVVTAHGAGADAQLCGHVTARDGAAPDPAVLRAFLRERLPEIMVPAWLVVLRELPLTPNGKIDRKALPAPDAAAAVRARPAAAAANELEDRILQVWKSAIGSDEVGVEDNFFDVGGHSILAVQVLRELEQALGRTIAITDLFRFPTVRSFARHMGAADGSAPTAAQQAVDRARARRERLGRGR